MQYTLYVADSLAANETRTLWFLILFLLKVPVAVLLFMLLTS